MNLDDQRRRLAATHPARQHPELDDSPTAASSTTTRASRRSRDFVEDAMMDAVTRYDIDGVHFDDYFYPYPVAGEAVPRLGAAYAQYGGGFSNVDGLAARQRRPARARRLGSAHQRGQAVGQVRRQPVRHLAQPGPPIRSARRPAGLQTVRRDLYADTRKWVKQGWIDYIVPADLLAHRLGRRRLRRARRLVVGRRQRAPHGAALHRAGDLPRPARPAQRPGLEHVTRRSSATT